MIVPTPRMSTHFGQVENIDFLLANPVDLYALKIGVRFPCFHPCCWRDDMRHVKQQNAFTYYDAFETFLLSAFLGILLFLPSMVEAGVDVFGRQVKKMERVSENVSVSLSAQLRQLMR